MKISRCITALAASASMLLQAVPIQWMPQHPGMSRTIPRKAILRRTIPIPGKKSLPQIYPTIIRKMLFPTADITITSTKIPKYLAVINDSEENEVLYQYMLSIGREEAFFGLGLYDGVWKYIAGDTSDFRDWGYNMENEAEPNNSGNNELHAELDIHMHDGHWNDTTFGKKVYTPDARPYKDRYAYICEWDN